MEPENKPDEQPPPVPQRDQRPDGSAQKPPAKGIITWIVIATMLLVMLTIYMSRQQQGREINLNEFDAELESGTVEEVVVVRDTSTGRNFLLVSKRPEKEGDEPEVLRVFTGMETAGIVDDVRSREGNIKVSYKYPSNVLPQLLYSVLPFLLIFGLIYFLFMRQVRSAGHGAMSFGKSRAKMNRDNNKVTFSDVAGCDEAKEEVSEIVDFLKDPKKFQKLGGRIPKGVMLMGPPGTGKTLLAKAIAGEADVPFFSISGSDFVEMFVGVGASRVRDMFEQGKKHAPCIIFIDEIDAVGRSRFSGIGGGHDEREQTLNALLVQMDGFETTSGVIILAATNRPDVLDEALLRPGRFDRSIMVDLPMVDGREEILKIHSKKIKLKDPEQSLSRIARATPGFSGADLENLLNEAALLAARQNKEEVELADMEEARDKVLWGRERRSRGMDDEDKRSTAYHEAGHALVQVLIEETEPVHKVTIIPRGMALGATMSLPKKDVLSISGKKLKGQIAVAMGGRIAEMLCTGDLSTGARQDIKQATGIARTMVCDLGMSEVLGPQCFGANQEHLFLGREVARTQTYSEATAQRIDEEIHALLSNGYQRAEELLKQHREKLEVVVERLIEYETIDGRDVEEIVELGHVRSAAEREAIDREKNGEPEPEPEAKESSTETEEVSDAGSDSDAKVEPAAEKPDPVIEKAEPDGDVELPAQTVDDVK